MSQSIEYGLKLENRQNTCQIIIYSNILIHNGLYVFFNFTVIKQKLETITKIHIREKFKKTILYKNIKHGLSNTHLQSDTNHYIWCDKHRGRDRDIMSMYQSAYKLISHFSANKTLHLSIPMEKTLSTFVNDWLNTANVHISHIFSLYKGREKILQLFSAESNKHKGGAC